MSSGMIQEDSIFGEDGMQVTIQNEDGSGRKGVCYIIGAGRIDNTGWLKRQIKPGEEDYVIAADGGFATCDQCGIPMNLVLGDFDSLGYIPAHPNLIRMAPEKDDTDMLFAVRQGMNLGYKTFELYGGTGGRPDHTMANYHTLAFLAKQGACGILCSPGILITAIHNDVLKLPAYESGTVSVFSMGDKAEGVTLTGLKYPLNQATVTNDFPIGVSNEFTGKAVQIKVEKGTLLIMWEHVGA